MGVQRASRGALQDRRERSDEMGTFVHRAFAVYQDRRMNGLFRDQAGVTLVEYGLAAAVISGLVALGSYFVFDSIATSAGTKVAGVLPSGLSAPMP